MIPPTCIEGPARAATGAPGATEATTLSRVLKERAARTPDRVVFRFLPDGEGEAEELTFGELERRARGIARRLRSRARAGERALLVHRPGLDYVAALFGCFRAGVVAVPCYPPRRRSDGRLAAIAADCSPAVVLADRETAEKGFAGLERLPRISTEDSGDVGAEEAGAESETGEHASADDVALIQYSSGSTAEPKGVMITHANALANLEVLRKYIGEGEHRGVVWLPPYHDMGLIGGILMPLYAGFPMTLMPPAAFLQKPERWLRGLSRERATLTAAPNFAYELCADAAVREEIEGLDLSSWRIAINGAEVVRPETLERFSDRFAASGFRRETFAPCYGLAEGTLIVSGVPVGEAPRCRSFDADAMGRGEATEIQDVERGDNVRELAPCGAALEGVGLRVVDPATCESLEDGRVGEVWVRGASVAAGYWDRPELTERTFNAFTTAGEGPYLRTGDLGFLAGNELFVTGRMKDVIVLRGRNHYPTDVERTAEASHAALQPGACAAFALHAGDRERLGLVAEVRREARRADPAPVIEAIRAAVSREHGVAVHAIDLVRPGTIEKTSSGKIARYKNRERMLAGDPRPIASSRLNGAQATRDDASDRRARNGGAGDLAARASSAEAGRGGTGCVSAKNRVVKERTAGASAARDGRAEAANGCAKIPATSAPGARRPSGSTGRTGARVFDNLITWLREELAPRFDARLADERRSIPPHVVLELAGQGFFGLQVPVEDGGLGLGHLDTLRVMEQLAAVDLTLATMVGCHNSLGLAPIAKHARAGLRAELVGTLARGAGLAAYGMTERGAGSNPRAMATRAVPDGKGGWRLHGSKWMSGCASWARSIVVTARVDEPDAEGRSGLTAFVVRQGAPGLRQGPEALTMGLRGMVQNAFELDGVAVGPEDVLGEVGEGFAVAQESMMLSRIGLAALAVGGMKRCAQLMQRWAARRPVATGTLLANPVAANRIGDVVSAATAVEALAHAVARRLDRGENVPEDALLACKIAGTELLGSATDSLVQLLGARGYLESNPAPRMLRDARAFRILEGPTETLATHLGSRARETSAEVFAFLRELGAADVAERLAVEIRAATAGGRSGWDRWLEAGEAVEAALLHAAAGDGTDERVRAWTRDRFEARIERLRLAPSTPWTANEIEAAVIRFETSIGTIEPGVVGEEVELDPMLRPDAPTAFPATPAPAAELPRQVHARHEAAPTPVEAPTAGDGESELFAWLRTWIARETGADARDVRGDRCLGGLGVDSLLLVQLQSDLEERLGRTVTAEELYEAQDLADLARQLGVPATSSRPGTGESSATPVGDTHSSSARSESTSGAIPSPSSEWRTDTEDREAPESGVPTTVPAQQTVEPQFDVASFPEVLALQDKLRGLRAAGGVPYFRESVGIAGRTTEIDGRTLVNFGSYNYLGLGRDARVLEAAREAIATTGTSVSASRLAGGERPVHRELEAEMARFLGCDDCLAYVGGHATNVATIGHLLGPKDAVVGDALIHNSIAEGAERSGARRYSFPHDDWRALDALLTRVRGRHRRVLIAVEGVYSADGDLADLPRCVELKRKHGALLLVDEAHSLGVVGATGRGVGEHFGVERNEVDLWMGTFSKALASCGGYIAGSAELVEYLRYTCGGFVYSVGMPPASAAAALAALRVLDAEPGRARRVQAVAARFLELARAHGLDTGSSAGSAVVPVIVGGSARAVAMAARLEERGVYAVPMISPSVEEGAARLRIFLSADHTDDDLEHGVRAIAAALRETEIEIETCDEEAAA